MSTINRNTFSFRDYAKPMYVPQADGMLKLTHSPVPSPEQLLSDYKSGKKQIGGWHYSYAVAAFQKVLTTHTKRDRSEGSLPRRTLTGIMEKFNQRVRAAGRWHAQTDAFPGSFARAVAQRLQVG
jgi:hypothetical protein